MDLKTVDELNSRREIIQSAIPAIRSKIDSGELQEVDMPVTHRFAPSVYLREIFMPKGAMVIGKIHSTEHFNIIVEGAGTVITAEGKEDFVAPYTFVSKAGVQKCVLVTEDCKWQTVHVTDKTDIDEIEKEVIVESYNDLVVDGLLEEVLKNEGLLCHGEQ